MAKRNYLLGIEVDQLVEKDRIALHCNERMITDEYGRQTVSIKCAGCHHYRPYDQLCEIRDDIIQGLNEDHQYAELGI
jgi:hypothetical protein